MKKMKLGIMVFSVVLSSLNVANAAEIKLSSGGPFIDNFVKPYKERFEKETGHKLIATEKGFKFGVLGLEKGEIDVSAGGFSPEDFPKLLKKEAVEVKDAALFQVFIVGEEKIQVAINKANPVNTLNKEQLKGIFTGKINNWKEVGGTDGEIIVVWVKFTQAPNETFIKKIMDGTVPTKDVLEVNMLGDAKSNVISTPQAIMIYPSSFRDEKLKFVESPEVTRPTVMMTKGAPSPAVKTFIDFVKAEFAKRK